MATSDERDEILRAHVTDERDGQIVIAGSDSKLHVADDGKPLCGHSTHQTDWKTKPVAVYPGWPWCKDCFNLVTTGKQGFHESPDVKRRPLRWDL
jgi:hypothetical protein